MFIKEITTSTGTHKDLWFLAGLRPGCMLTSAYSHQKCQKYCNVRVHHWFCWHYNRRGAATCCVFSSWSQVDFGNGTLFLLFKLIFVGYPLDSLDTMKQHWVYLHHIPRVLQFKISFWMHSTWLDSRHLLPLLLLSDHGVEMDNPWGKTNKTGYITGRKLSKQNQRLSRKVRTTKSD